MSLFIFLLDDDVATGTAAGEGGGTAAVAGVAEAALSGRWVCGSIPRL